MILTPVDIERYWRIHHNPYKRAGMSFERAMIFCDQIEHAMRKLSEPEQIVMQCVAAGFRVNEMGMSARTVSRIVHRLRKRDDLMIPRLHGRGIAQRSE